MKKLDAVNFFITLPYFLANFVPRTIRQPVTKIKYTATYILVWWPLNIRWSATAVQKHQRMPLCNWSAHSITSKDACPVRKILRHRDLCIKRRRRAAPDITQCLEPLQNAFFHFQQGKRNLTQFLIENFKVWFTILHMCFIPICCSSIFVSSTTNLFQRRYLPSPMPQH